MVLCRLGHVEFVKRLAKDPLLLNSVDDKSENSLFYATHAPPGARLAIIRVLALQGANISQTNANNVS